MKIIDLLNKIANGEEVKAKLKFKLGDIIITYYGQDNYYHTPEYNIEYIDKECITHDFTLGMLIKSLNDEVEILEEEKKIPEKLKDIIKDGCIEAPDNFILMDKINEIIDYYKKDNEKFEKYMKDYTEEQLKTTFQKKYQKYKNRKILLDYITNLEQENERLKQLCDKYEEEHNTTFNEWKETITDKYQTLKDLQEENERLKENNKKKTSRCTERNHRIRSCQRIIERRNKKISKLEDYKSRNEKAIEYIKQNSKCGGSFIDNKFVIEYIDEIFNGMELLNILNGDDEE
jgi:DNA repair exonuclease SbcCD ATPase subunit